MISKGKDRGVKSDIQLSKTLHKNLNFASSEAYKLLRTNLLFSLPDEGRCRIIGVTSSIRGEGKSTTSINLSYSLAEMGHNVLLIDADMRLPSVAKKMNIKGALGLSNILVGNDNLKLSCVRSGVLDNWYILPSGDIPPNPSELLGSKRMKNVLMQCSKAFNFIIVDLPPVNVVSDASVIGGLFDGVIVVVREGYTDKRSLRDCSEQIRLSRTRLLGYVVNDTKNASQYHRY